MNRDCNPISNTNYLYVVKCEEAYKIGVSSLPEQRISLIRTDNYKDVETVAIIKLEHAYHVEKLVHGMLKRLGFHIKGEWFNLPSEEIETILNAIFYEDASVTV